MSKLFLPLFILTLQASCFKTEPNLNAAGEGVFEDKEIYVDEVNLNHRDTVYIPIYSDIYSETKDIRFNLTATLSIRNTSLQDSIYIEDIDYYDTEGKLVRHFIDRILLLSPMQSIDFVIEENDTAGGTGANFIVNWGSNSGHVVPVFQGVMISTNGQQGISFLTSGISISRK